MKLFRNSKVRKKNLRKNNKRIKKNLRKMKINSQMNRVKKFSKKKKNKLQKSRRQERIIIIDHKSKRKKRRDLNIRLIIPSEKKISKILKNSMDFQIYSKNCCTSEATKVKMPVKRYYQSQKEFVNFQKPTLVTK